MEKESPSRNWHIHASNVLVPLFCRAVAITAYAYSVSVFINVRGAQDYALIGLVVTLLSFAPLLDFGIGYALTMRLVRVQSRHAGRMSTIVGEAVVPFLALALLLAVMGIGASRFLSELLFKTPDFGFELALAFVGAAVLLVDALPSAVLQAENRIDQLGIARLLPDAGRSASVFAAAVWHWPTQWILASFIVVALLKLVITCWLARRIVRWPWLSIGSRSAGKLLIQIGAPLGMCAALSTLFNLIDKGLASRMLGDASAAHYLIAVDVNVRAYFLIWAVHSALYTLFMRRAAAKQGSGNLLRVSFASTLVVGLCYYLPLAVFAEPILAYWINPQFGLEASGAVRFLALASVLYMFSDAHTMLLRAHRKQFLEMIGLMVGIAVLLFAGFIGASRAGLVGLAGAVLAGHAAILMTSVYFARRYNLYR